MEPFERINKLEEAKSAIHKATRLIKEAIADTDQETYVTAYMVAHLTNWADGEHGLDTTCSKLITMFDENPERYIY